MQYTCMYNLACTIIHSQSDDKDTMMLHTSWVLQSAAVQDVQPAGWDVQPAGWGISTRSPSGSFKPAHGLVRVAGGIAGDGWVGRGTISGHGGRGLARVRLTRVRLSGWWLARVRLSSRWRVCSYRLGNGGYWRRSCMAHRVAWCRHGNRHRHHGDGGVAVPMVTMVSVVMVAGVRWRLVVSVSVSVDTMAVVRLVEDVGADGGVFGLSVLHLCLRLKHHRSGNVPMGCSSCGLVVEASLLAFRSVLLLSRLVLGASHLDPSCFSVSPGGESDRAMSLTCCGVIGTGAKHYTLNSTPTTQDCEKVKRGKSTLKHLPFCIVCQVLGTPIDPGLLVSPSAPVQPVCGRACSAYIHEHY
eukprot:scpid71154/ scgid19244/ 